MWYGTRQPGSLLTPSQFTASADGSVGDKFSFKITANTGSNNNAPDQTTGRDKVFTITDKLGAGFTLDTVTGFTVTNTTTHTVLSATGENPDYSVTTVAGTGDDAGKTIITITLNASALAKQNETITVDYKATLNENAIDNNASATNNANGKETKTYTYDFALDKVDKANHETKLSGVKFTLTNSDGKYYVAPSDTENVNEAVFGDAENKLGVSKEPG
ncbi:MAG: isopeptide-forming domain-containing fimbrial protein [Lachnospiraceae bacterium]|nr:isopeptide-forming domain-containing fimbrial protein [Lachnospiraceae bacterium]